MTAQTEVVKVSLLNVGDVVRAHGGRFRLTKLTYDQDEGGAHGGALDAGNTRAFATEYLGAAPDRECSIPASWIPLYTIQSNDLGRWAREIA